MKIVISFILCLAAICCLSGCGILPANSVTASPDQTIGQADWPADPRYHAQVGDVVVTSGGVSCKPVANFLNASTYSGGGWLCADGRSLMYGNEEELEELEKTLPSIKYSGEITVDISGGNGHLASFYIYDKDHQSIGDGRIRPKDDKTVVLPEDDRICYVSIRIGWAAELPPPGQDEREGTGYEYLFIVE